MISCASDSWVACFAAVKDRVVRCQVVGMPNGTRRTLSDTLKCWVLPLVGEFEHSDDWAAWLCASVDADLTKSVHPKLNALPLARPTEEFWYPKAMERDIFVVVHEWGKLCRQASWNEASDLL